ncbi:MAG: hypothetical protein JRD89_03040 [Deltaproteobacteria bacterium]|nr:hypothetical protein [Deltaproteobacteria bacterium]
MRVVHGFPAGRGQHTDRATGSAAEFLLGAHRTGDPYPRTKTWRAARLEPEQLWRRPDGHREPSAVFERLDADDPTGHPNGHGYRWLERDTDGGFTMREAWAKFRSVP